MTSENTCGTQHPLPSILLCLLFPVTESGRMLCFCVQIVNKYLHVFKCDWIVLCSQTCNRSTFYIIVDIIWVSWYSVWLRKVTLIKVEYFTCVHVVHDQAFNMRYIQSYQISLLCKHPSIKWLEWIEIHVSLLILAFSWIMKQGCLN